jgi:putative hydrolase of the HAD superfamily
LGREIDGVALEAVIWDFGGVFTTSPFEAFNRYEAQVGAPHDIIRRVNSTNPDTNAWAQFERSAIRCAGAISCPCCAATSGRGWWRR